MARDAVHAEGRCSTSLARDGYDLIIGVGFAQGDALGKVAQRFPDSKFAIIDVDQAFVPGKPANVQGLLFREEEVGYLAGYLAALTEKRRSGPDVISAVFMSVWISVVLRARL